MALRHKLSWSSVLPTLATSFAAIILCSCSAVVSSGNQGSPGNGGSSTTKVTPTLAWASPSPITNPTPLSATQLDATASVAGSFVYNPPAGTVLAAGTQTLSVTFTPTNTAAYSQAHASVSITVNPPTQTGGSPDAYLYVSSSSNSGNNNVDVFA